MNTEGMNRRQRRAARKDGKLDKSAFLKVADKFIDLANRQNKHVQATDLHNAFLYAAARYNAFVANSVLRVEDHEEFVQEMVKQYAEMLRQHLSDPNLAAPEQSGAV
jgi:menaquinone-dependent protoporphyrinogen IX oxidase